VRKKPIKEKEKKEAKILGIEILAALFMVLFTRTIGAC
jgi:hypothetical protein